MGLALVSEKQSGGLDEAGLGLLKVGLKCHDSDLQIQWFLAMYLNYVYYDH